MVAIQDEPHLGARGQRPNEARRPGAADGDKLRQRRAPVCRVTCEGGPSSQVLLHGNQEILEVPRFDEEPAAEPLAVGVLNEPRLCIRGEGTKEIELPETLAFEEAVAPECGWWTMA
jgi:hypothetical protein